jgi:hypothetical protein
MSFITTDDRGVSETLGYIMIFGVVVAGIAMVFLIGSHIIENTQESASFQGLEQSFAVVGTDLRSTALEESPMMTTRVKIDYGVLSLLPEDTSGSEVMIYGDTNLDGVLIQKYDQHIGMLTFNSQTYGKSIALENGALVEMFDGNGAYGSAMTLQPRIFYSKSTNTLMVTVINLKRVNPLEDYTSVTGGIENIQTQYLDNTLQDFPGLSSASICIRTNYTGAWNDYFVNNMPDASKSLDTTGDTGNWTNVTFTGISRMLVLTYNIGVQI